MDQSERSLSGVDGIFELLAQTVVEAQEAALAGRLLELESATRRQTELSERLRGQLQREKGLATSSLDLPSPEAAQRLRSQMQVFRKVIRKMQQNFFSAENARRGISLPYPQPPRAGKA